MEYCHLENRDVRNLLKNIFIMSLNSSEHKNCILNCNGYSVLLVRVGTSLFVVTHH